MLPSVNDVPLMQPLLFKAFTVFHVDIKEVGRCICQRSAGADGAGLADGAGRRHGVQAVQWPINMAAGTLVLFPVCVWPLPLPFITCLLNT